MRQPEYPGSDITIEQTLAPGSNYNRHVVSYKSDGLKIYALMTVPKSAKPKTGYPAIIFNHGYIAPAQYRTTERYVAYVDAIAKSGYIVFKSDYRGNGNSEGAPGGHFSPAYTIDVLNALGSVKKYKDTDPNRIGMWGHSLGGDITLRAMVVSREIKAGVIWAGTVGSYAEQTNMWGRRHGSQGGPGPGSTPSAPQGFEQFGTPQQNPQFWDSISPNNYVADLSGPLQLHHGTADQEVPLRFSEELYAQVQAVGKTIEFYKYPGSDHNISQGFTQAMQRTIAFFDKYVKGK
ncbi:MAG: prolyl oligopeptidase family serine peptidase [Chloroflexi bacterium]|nr:prolyl oligopeptidase family serine peptidase [Chloroflexota bacterium]